MTSALHTRTKELLHKIFPLARIREEVNVKKLFSEYGPRGEFYDLVLPALQIIVECHGEQHKNIACFGNQNVGEAYINLQQQKRRDAAKEEIALLNGWNYIIVWYDELPSRDDLAIQILNRKILQAAEQ